MKKYELTYLIPSNIEEKEIKSLSEKISAVIKEKGGDLDASRNNPVKKNLAYPIKNQTSAYVHSLTFASEPEKLELIKGGVENEPKILNFSLVKKRKLKERPLRLRLRKKFIQAPLEKTKEKTEEKVELKELDKKLEEILGE